ncbi:hypothetical protein SeLEV6574_g08308 [Synchytrium endobioticum]|uniref:Uncharacterized protein n=1 Tax=Synchytrium endobioticum TaxID=286115 RepID=A0A507BZB6_9FUNG|nr:hypothetical protein SeLEV6574_g08308 [Synchytrium endobioticum]
MSISIHVHACVRVLPADAMNGAQKRPASDVHEESVNSYRLVKKSFVGRPSASSDQPRPSLTPAATPSNASQTPLYHTYAQTVYNPPSASASASASTPPVPIKLEPPATSPSSPFLTRHPPDSKLPVPASPDPSAHLYVQILTDMEKRFDKFATEVFQRIDQLEDSVKQIPACAAACEQRIPVSEFAVKSPEIPVDLNHKSVVASRMKRGRPRKHQVKESTIRPRNYAHAYIQMACETDLFPKGTSLMRRASISFFGDADAYKKKFRLSRNRKTIIRFRANLKTEVRLHLKELVASDGVNHKLKSRAQDVLRTGEHLHVDGKKYNSPILARTLALLYRGSDMSLRFETYSLPMIAFACSTLTFFLQNCNFKGGQLQHKSAEQDYATVLEDLHASASHDPSALQNTIRLLWDAGANDAQKPARWLKVYPHTLMRVTNVREYEVSETSDTDTSDHDDDGDMNSDDGDEESEAAEEDEGPVRLYKETKTFTHTFIHVACKIDLFPTDDNVINEASREFYGDVDAWKRRNPSYMRGGTLGQFRAEIRNEIMCSLRILVDAGSGNLKTVCESLLHANRHLHSEKMYNSKVLAKTLALTFRGVDHPLRFETYSISMIAFVSATLTFCMQNCDHRGSQIQCPTSEQDYETALRDLMRYKNMAPEELASSIRYLWTYGDEAALRPLNWLASHRMIVPRPEPKSSQKQSNDEGDPADDSSEEYEEDDDDVRDESFGL